MEEDTSTKLEKARAELARIAGEHEALTTEQRRLGDLKAAAKAAGDFEAFDVACSAYDAHARRVEFNEGRLAPAQAEVARLEHVVQVEALEAMQQRHALAVQNVTDTARELARLHADYHAKANGLELSIIAVSDDQKRIQAAQQALGQKPSTFRDLEQMARGHFIAAFAGYDTARAAFLTSWTMTDRFENRRHVFAALADVFGMGAHEPDKFGLERGIQALLDGTFGAVVNEFDRSERAKADASRERKNERMRTEFEAEVAQALKINPDWTRDLAVAAVVKTHRYDVAIVLQ